MGLVCVNVRKLREGERDKVERISVSFGYSEEAIAKTMIMTFSLSLLFLFLYYHFDYHNKNLCVLRQVFITFHVYGVSIIKLNLLPKLLSMSNKFGR